MFMEDLSKHEVYSISFGKQFKGTSRCVSPQIFCEQFTLYFYQFNFLTSITVDQMICWTQLAFSRSILTLLVTA